MQSPSSGEVDVVLRYDGPFVQGKTNVNSPEVRRVLLALTGLLVNASMAARAPVGPVPIALEPHLRLEAVA